MTQNETIVSLSDLRYVEIHCWCGTKVTLDMEDPPEFGKKHGVFAPQQCPGCRTDYDSAIKPAVDSFQRAYSSLIQLRESITFRGLSNPVTAKQS